jgi:hypothetical protein
VSGSGTVRSIGAGLPSRLPSVVCLAVQVVLHRKAALARTRSLKITDVTKDLDQATIDRARQLGRPKA